MSENSRYQKLANVNETRWTRKTSQAYSSESATNQYPWDEDAHSKRFLEEIATLQKELIGETEKRSSSNPSKLFNIEPNITFIDGEPVLTASEEPLFNITNDEESIIMMALRLSLQSTAMIAKIDELVHFTGLPFHLKYRLELRPVSFYSKNTENRMWQLRLNVDPVTWFDLEWRQCNSNEDCQRKCLGKARSYIETYRTFVPNQVPPTSVHEPITAPPYCPYQLTCEKKYNHSKHSRIICQTKATGQWDDGNRLCGQYFIEEYVTMEWPVKQLVSSLNKIENFGKSAAEYGKNYNINHSTFIYSVKKEITRDLVMFPKPPWHISNRELVKLPLFWTVAIYTTRLLNQQLKIKLQHQPEEYPVEAIAINFGQWETAGSYDPRLIDCHAHSHFLLTLEFIEACDATFFPPLKGRVMATPDYLRQNAQLLYNNRIQNHEFDSRQMDSFSKRLNRVEEQQKDIRVDIQEVKQDINGMKEDIHGMKEDFQSKFQTLEKSVGTIFEFLKAHLKGSLTENER